MVDRQRQARPRHVRAVRCRRADRPRGDAPCDAQAADEVPVRHARGGSVLMAVTATEIRALGDEEIVTRLREAKEELFNLRFQVATGQLDNNRRLQTIRRDIARIYTVLRERELGITYEAVESTNA